ncbi:MAG TPA: hypothetical protein VNQ14_12640 [Woeseiaceae bacterium]|nr:hypothetical protein [Woeseiaceae bacterium]
MSIDLRRSIPWMLTLIGTALSAGNLNAAEAEITSLRMEFDELRAEYEARISSLEQRLAVAEQNARQANTRVAQLDTAAAPAAPISPASRAAGGDSTFNPAIGVIFQGQAWNYGDDPDDYAIQGFPLGGEAGPVAEGLSLGETEINLSANVDDKFTAWLTLPVVIEDGESAIEIEEAWLETLSLPAGLSARFGRFFSGIGYLNDKHAHAWDFADQPLPYQAFLGDQYLDDGVQFRWIAPTDIFLEVGAEVLRGGRYPAAGAGNSGFGGQSLFVNTGGDVGTGHSWLAGLSFLDTESIDRPSGSEDAPVLFSGDSMTAIAEFVWKWSPNGNWKQKNFVVQSEFIWRNDDGVYALPGSAPLAYDTDQRGWYAQAIYQPFPRWRFGTRIDALSMDDPGLAFAGTELGRRGSDPRRYSVMADWSNSEFSRLRLQYTRDEARVGDDNQWGLQYTLSIGAHGAHSF